MDIAHPATFVIELVYFRRLRFSNTTPARVAEALPLTRRLPPQPR